MKRLESCVSAARLVIDRVSRQRAGARHTVEESADQIPSTFREDLTIIIQPLARLMSNRFGGRESLNMALGPACPPVCKVPSPSESRLGTGSPYRSKAQRPTEFATRV